jgi:CubicO group peptidase (beta-lactamase class C family)
MLVARRGTIALHEAFGRMSPEPDAPPVEPDSVFLLASITKPVTATAVMLLVERGRVSLDDPVSRYIPEFRGGERGRVLVRHLLSHTSGLPDMLPENLQLRRAHAPLSEFVRRTCATPLLFTPGTRVSYQSMGTLLAGEIVQRVTGERLRDFLRREIFRVLGMKNSSLGLGKRRVSETVWSSGPPEASKQDLAIYGWSTEYWRDLGAPWGGMHATTTDLAALLQTFLNGGAYEGRRLLKPETAKAMITDQNRGLHSPWGLGWALAGSRAWNYFGKRVSPNTFGHVGATGTIAWADPEKELICVVLTNRPVDVDKGELLRKVSEAVAGAAERWGGSPDNPPK